MFLFILISHLGSMSYDFIDLDGITKNPYNFSKLIRMVVAGGVARVSAAWGVS